ncbi:MAG: hypothetical protein K1X53_15190 [Candidatus Sumerlaeaceae bacterium]|nr:hypothetical protein [Candidatus Sumerlaeaceae bacterium]
MLNLKCHWSDVVLVALLVALAAGWWAMPFGGLGHRLGEYISSLGWDSGPPDEYAYDFIFSWHFALSCLALLPFVRFGAFASPLVWAYPLAALTIFWVFPWNTENGAQKMLATMTYLPFFWGLLALSQSPTASHNRSLSLPLICILGSLISFYTPISGSGIFVATIWLGSLAIGLIALRERVRVWAES